LRIRLFYETNFRLRDWRKARKIIEWVIRKENKIPGDINIILTDDETLRKMNLQFLEHDYFTDVIAFSDNKGDVINGEVYISIETVKMNAINYKVSLNHELLRVVFHGVLHLVGYDDRTDRQKREMSKMEDRWLDKMKLKKDEFFL
jgi:probable rRNA maturation factor